MGGCRCTYSNCTVRSDGQTHMFHYPVFEKVRCHQWLTNAGRLDFLNLKVSQLKNRVVCQYHFKDDNFMNFKKDKLTFDAVPTEDGPYCDSSKKADIKPEVDLERDSITADDIENDFVYTLTDKIANFSVKYSDFLTNSESDLDLLTENLASTNVKNNICDDRLPFSSSNDTIHHENPAINNVDKTKRKPQVLMSKECVKDNNANAICISNSSNSDGKNKNSDFKKYNNKQPFKKESKVHIISEEKVSKPVSFKGVLKPVSPSLVLCPRKKPLTSILKMNDKVKTTEKPNNEEPPKQIITQDVPLLIQNKESKVPFAIEINIDTSQPIKQENYNMLQNSKINTLTPEENKINSHKYLNRNNKTVLESRPQVSPVKPRIAPERAAVIEEKRKFNMKLRDIIENCLNGLEETDKKKDKEIKTKKEASEKVGPFLSTDPNLPNKQNYTIAYLEARMKKMEDNLLNKISQNAKNIIDLKQVVTTPKTKISSTQTANTEESHKRYLYKEISKYLSPEANSMIYEELFINKFAQNARKCSPSPKRRKRR